MPPPFIALQENKSVKALCFIAAMIACPLGSVSATTLFCVHDGAELAAALATAATDNDDDDIRLTPGTYTPIGDGFVFNSSDPHGLAITGGYTTAPGAPPCSTLLGGAQWSVLDGAGNTRVLYILLSGTSTAPVFVRDLTLANGTSTGTTAPIVISGTNEWTGNTTIDNVSVRGNHTSFAIALLGGNGRAVVRNSEFVGNTSTSASGVVLGLVSNWAVNDTSIVFNNNTIAGNSVPATSTRAGVSFGGNSPGAVLIANNIVWNNGGTDVTLHTTGPVFLDHNDIGSRVVVGEMAVTEINPYDVDPHFVAIDDMHLTSSSPLRDAGVASPVGGVGATDVEGNTRVVFGGVDVGAHEIQDRIFEDGFE